MKKRMVYSHDTFDKGNTCRMLLIGKYLTGFIPPAVNGKSFFFGVGISSAKPDTALLAAVLSLILVFFPARTAVGGEVSLDEAARLAVSGEHAAAEALYSRLLEADPGRLEAYIGRGHVRSWQGKHASAEEDFLAVLKKEPENVDALTGLGYNLTWSGRFREGEEPFRRALQIEPDRLDALKGHALAAFQQGNAVEALLRYEAVLQKFPDDVEAWVGLGRARLAAGAAEKGRQAFERALQVEPGRRDALEGIEIARKTERKGPSDADASARVGWDKLASGHHREARRAFLRSLALEPGRTDALAGIDAVREAPVPFEVSLWGGHTFNGGDTGLRSLEVAGWPGRDHRLWIRYDNALSLDNPALVRLGKKIPSFFAGGLANWKENYTTKLEAGYRELPDGIDQRLYLAEQVIHLPDARSIKAGGLLALRDDDRTDWNTYMGFGFPMTSRLRLEPTLFYTRGGPVDENEKRFLLAGEYRFERGRRIGAGLALGRFESEIPGASGGLWAAHFIGILPLGDAHRATFLIRHETPPNGEAFTTIALGLTFRLERE